jgi:medium-chain acyl-[acyl-carrier-protein] hydrolase
MYMRLSGRSCVRVFLTRFSGIAWELYDEIRRNADQEPMCVVMSGRHPPFEVDNRRKTHTLPAAELKEYLWELGGIAKEIYEDKKMFEFFLPLIRSDLRMVENYEPGGSRITFRCPVYAFTGTDDKLVQLSEFKKWKEYAEGAFDYYEVEGGHFFITENVKQVTGILNSILCNTGAIGI